MPKTGFSDVTDSRRKIMRAIKSKDTRPEVLLRKALWRTGYRYRKNYKVLKGTPDIVLTKYRIAIFVDSEFFHGKNYEELISRLKKGNNSEYWIKKINDNIRRDNEVNVTLRNQEYTVLRFWGEDVIKNTNECIEVIKEAIWETQLQSITFDE